jgi:curli production assembly/transport component CsgF
MSGASASELVYTPVNPLFGGNPNNGPNLLAIANAQNTTTAPKTTALERFNTNLEQAILSRLSSEALRTIFGTGTTLQTGTYDAGSYTITIESIGDNNLQITTLDKNTGASTTFVLNNTGQL